MALSTIWGYNYLTAWEKNLGDKHTQISLRVPDNLPRKDTILLLARELHHVLYGELIPDEDLKYVEELLDA